MSTANPTIIRALREFHGFTVRDLAGVTGLSRQTIHAIEAGRAKPRARNVDRLADALGVDRLTLTADLDDERHRMKVVGVFYQRGMSIEAIATALHLRNRTVSAAINAMSVAQEASA